MMTAALLMGAGYLILSQVDSYASFLIVYLGIISLVHAGGLSAWRRRWLVNTWFIRQRARAITLNSAAFGLGGVLIAPTLEPDRSGLGVAMGAAIAGMTFLVIGLPICATVRRSPESMGLLPDGDAPPDAATSGGPTPRGLKSRSRSPKHCAPSPSGARCSPAACAMRLIMPCPCISFR